MTHPAERLAEALERISSNPNYDDAERMKDCRVIANKSLAYYRAWKEKQPSDYGLTSDENIALEVLQSYREKTQGVEGIISIKMKREHLLTVLSGITKLKAAITRIQNSKPEGE